MLKFMTLVSFVALVAHSALAQQGSLNTATVRMALALLFIVLLLILLKKEFGEFITPPSKT